MITGRDLNEMREALGMSVTEFAILMCVGTTTPSKWGSMAGSDREVGGFPAMLCQKFKEGPADGWELIAGRGFMDDCVRNGQFWAISRFLQTIREEFDVVDGDEP